MIRTPEEQYLHELIESYVAPLRSEINALRKELAEHQVKNLNIPDVVGRSKLFKCPTCYDTKVKDNGDYCADCEEPPDGI